MSPQIRVHRKGYTRKDGIYVKPITFLIKDRDWHRYMYVEVPESKLGKLKEFLIENKITEEKNIEDVESFNFPVQPVEDIFLLVKFLKENGIDFNLIPYIKLPKKDQDIFWKFVEDNNIWDEEV